MRQHLKDFLIDSFDRSQFSMSSVQIGFGFIDGVVSNEISYQLTLSDLATHASAIKIVFSVRTWLGVAVIYTRTP
jgi:hypothetical protein